MAVHDTAGVPALEEGHAGTDRYPALLPAGMEPERRRSRSGPGSSAGRGGRRERVRAFLEIQVRPEEPGACARILSWRPRRRGVLSPRRRTPGGKILELMPEGAS